MARLSALAVVLFGAFLVQCEDGVDLGADAGAGDAMSAMPSADGALDDASEATDAAASADDGATAEGDAATVREDGATTEGDGATTEGDGATTEGDGATTEGDGATIETDGATPETDGASILDATPTDGGLTPAGDASTPDAGPGPRFIDFANLTWRTQVIIDQTLTVFGVPQASAPRNLRGLAASPDGRYLYAGYINTSSVTAEVRRVDTATTGSIAPFVAHVVGAGGKAIAVDDLGRVYVAGQSRISVFTPALDQLLYVIDGLEVCEGLAVTREAGQLILYTSERYLGVLERWVVSEAAGAITGAVRSGWGGSGRIVLDPAADLRSVRVDPRGRIWVVGRAGDVVFRVSADGLQVAIVPVTAPFDIGFDSTLALITHGTSREVDRLDSDSLLPLAPVVMPPWATLGLVPDGKFGNGAITGLVVVPGVGFYAANESGATFPYPSPTDPTNMIDNNDPILWAESP